MAGIQYNTSDLNIMARVMRAEAADQGDLGELLVGNVVVNRVKAGCLDFPKINTVSQAVFQPHGFSCVYYSYFYQRARIKEKRLALKVLKGLRYHPAEYSLYYYRPPGNDGCRPEWYGQWNDGRFKAHCFYKSLDSDCPNIYH